MAADSPAPRLTPQIPGSWQAIDPYVLQFRPAGHLPLFTTVHLSIPAGSAGAHGRDGSRLVVRYSTAFTVGGASSVLRLQQLLAELGYLPVRFRPRATSVSPTSAPTPTPGMTTTAASGASGGSSPTAQPSGSAQASASPSAAASASPSAAASATAAAGVSPPAVAAEPGDPTLISLEPLAGSFSWRYHHIPRSLAALWQRGSYTVLLKGAVMAFEADHGLTVDGVVGPQVWVDLLRSIARRQVDRRPYDYIEVSESLPETLRVWQAGKVIYRCPANTGIASRPTEGGTFPVFERFVSTTMSGTNPDGSHYSDPGVPYVAYFNGGDAVHGFLRSQYGYPQSLGCVELSYAAAAIVFRYDPLGTLVSVL